MSVGIKNSILKSATAKGACLICAVGLSACGGSGGDGSAVQGANLSQTALFAPNQANASRRLTLAVADGTTGSAFFENATLVNANRINGSSIAGDIKTSTSNSAAAYEVALNSGGVAYLNGGAQGSEYMFTFTNGTRAGVAGERSSTLPGGQASFTGIGNVTVNDGTGTRPVTERSSDTDR